MKKGLFEIVQDYERIMFNIEENDGVIEDSELEALEINQEELEEKLRAYKHIIDKNNSDIEYNKDEIDRLRSRNKTREESTKYLKKRITDALHIYGVRGKTNFSLKYPDFTVYTKESKSVNVDSQSIDTLLQDILNNLATDEQIKFFEDHDFILQDCGSIEVKLELSVQEFADYIKSREEVYGSILDGSNINFKPNKKLIKELNDKAEQLADDIEKNPDGNWDNEKDIVTRISDVMNELEVEFNTSETAIFK